MKKILFVTLLIVSGCNAGGLTPNQKVEATKQWNDARASVLASLANDQYKSGNFDKCQVTLDQALRLVPTNVSLHLLGAKLAIEQGKLELAQAHLTEAARMDAKNAEVDYLRGVVMQRWQQPQKACDAYAAAASKSPAEISYLLAQAEMLVELSRPADALTLLQARAAYFEHSGVLRDEMGQIYTQLSQPDQAVVELREASILSADDSSIREHLGFALLVDKQFTEALEVFARLSKDPAYGNRADVFAALGICQSHTNQPQQAAAAYQTATSLQPTCVGYWIGLAKSSVESNNLPVAESALRQIEKLEPNRADAKCLLGYVRLKEDQLPASLVAFREATNLDPTDAVSLCLQGYILRRMGRPKDAKLLYSRALQLNPNDDLANHLMANLDSND